VNTPEDLVKKGIASARRDVAEFVSTSYDELLMIAMRRLPLKVAVAHIVSKLRLLLSGQVDYMKLSITGSVSEDYKLESSFMFVFSQRMTEAGCPIEAGSRVEYLIIKGKDGSNLGERMELLDRYVQMDDDEKPELDYMYIMTNKMKLIFSQCLEIGFKDDYEKLVGFDEKGYWPRSNRKKFRPALKLFDMVEAIIDDGYTYDEALYEVESIYGLVEEEK
jgi:DNA polymerase elongation subunit (family B)